METERTIHILLVEDNPTDVLLAQDALGEGRQFNVAVAERLGQALTLLTESPFDVVLLDVGLPDSQGLDTLLTLRQDNATIPVVVMTGRDDEELALRAVRAGAQDYLVKSQIRDGMLARSIRYAIERNQARQALRERADLAALSADVGMALIQSDTAREMLSACAESMVRNLGAAFARVWTLNPTENMLELQASAGMYTHIDGPHSRVPVGKFKIGLIAQEKEAHLTNDVRNDPRVGDQDWARREGMVAFAGYPLLINEHLVGVMAMFACRPLSQTTLEGMAAVANQIALGIERKRAEGALRHAEERLHFALTAGHVGIWDWNVLSGEVIWSDVLERINGLAPGTFDRTYEAFQKTVHPHDWTAVQQAIATALAQRSVFDVEFRSVWPDGSIHWITGTGRAFHDLGGNAVRMTGVAQDITQRKSLEDQFRQAQKMEAIGQLAGGVAHDFNNLLQVINGFSELLIDRLREGDPMRGMLEQIKKSGERAASLTRQLLAFSRKQMLVPVVLDLNTVVGEMDKMLRRLIGEDVNLLTSLDSHLWRVKADPGQVEQVVMNLVVNARDAMPQGGKLTIETRNVELDQQYVDAHRSAKPGEYALLAISDTGHGMDKATQARIFEPFFTTKGPEKGTGLGLATVYGIVKQSDGTIEVYSEPGQGTTFKVYLPRSLAVAPLRKSDPARPKSVRGSETILLVEDDAGVRSLTRMILEERGFSVLEAANGGEALLRCEQHQGPIHLLVTDVVMPNMSGPQLAERLAKLRPGLKRLFLSGYTDQAIVHHGVISADTPFLQKPFKAEALTRKIRELLDQQ